MSEDLELARALSVIDRAGREVLASPHALDASQQPIARLTAPNQAEAERLAGVGKQVLSDAAKIDARRLPHDIALSLKVAETTALRWSKSADWWWLVQDPLGVGFFGMFGPTAYCGGYFLESMTKLLAKQAIAKAADCDRYLGLISDYADIVHALTERLKGQADRQIVMPAVQLSQAKALVRALAARIPQRLARSAESLRGLETAEDFATAIKARVDREVTPALEALSAVLEGDYGERAGQRVGLGRYPGGRDVYEALVPHYLTLDLSAEAVHQEGLRRMKDIRRAMKALRQEVGFSGDDAAYVDACDADPKWRADTPDGVAAFFRRYMQWFGPHVETLFTQAPRSPYDVAALPEALAAAMTFGFYQPPEAPGAYGRFHFNGVNLTKQGLSRVAALNFHELVPGHHFHLASQIENTLLPPIRKYAFFNAFNEGWAEYAATLAGEMGGYAQPEEQFGRCRMDAFLTCRLVVDTGMNALGWSLEAARDYMRQNAFMSEQEVLTESVRYSCDIPGQSLAYKMGDTFLLDARAKMKTALGAKFDIKLFHDAVLGPGALPLPLVGQNVERATAAAA